MRWVKNDSFRKMHDTGKILELEGIIQRTNYAEKFWLRKASRWIYGNSQIIQEPIALHTHNGLMFPANMNFRTKRVTEDNGLLICRQVFYRSLSQMNPGSLILICFMKAPSHFHMKSECIKFYRFSIKVLFRAY